MAIYMVYGIMAYMVTTAATIKRGVDQATTEVSFVASGTVVVIIAEHALMVLQWIPRLFPCAGWILGLAAPAPASIAAPAMVMASSWDYRIHAALGAFLASAFSCFKPGG